MIAKVPVCLWDNNCSAYGTTTADHISKGICDVENVWADVQCCSCPLCYAVQYTWMAEYMSPFVGGGGLFLTALHLQHSFMACTLQLWFALLQFPGLLAML